MSVSDNGLQNDVRDAKNVEIKFVVSYETTWGENVFLSGSRGLLGAGDVRKGIRMHCVQAPQGLSWVANLQVPPGYECSYEYVVYNDHEQKVIARESEQHQLLVPRSCPGACIMLCDHFRVCAHFLLLHAAWHTMQHMCLTKVMRQCALLGHNAHLPIVKHIHCAHTAAPAHGHDARRRPTASTCCTAPPRSVM